MQDGENRIQLRLDRALATHEWRVKFTEMRVYHLVDSTSDHCALLLNSSPPTTVPCFSILLLLIDHHTLNASILRPYGQKIESVEKSLILPGGWGVI